MVPKHRASYRTSLVVDTFRVKDEFGDGVGRRRRGLERLGRRRDGVDGDDVGWAGLGRRRDGDGVEVREMRA